MNRYSYLNGYHKPIVCSDCWRHGKCSCDYDKELRELVERNKVMAHYRMEPLDAYYEEYRQLREEMISTEIGFLRPLVR